MRKKKENLKKMKENKWRKKEKYMKKLIFARKCNRKYPSRHPREKGEKSE